MSAATRIRITPEEYLKAERLAEFKSEYAAGELFSMAGARRNHNLISSNCIAAANTALSNRTCEVYGSDMRVSPTGDHYFYPDISVACDDIKFLDETQDTLINPTLIVEVLSDSTAAYDRSGKFFQYRQIASLQHYVLISQDRILVEHHARQPNGDWLLKELKTLEDVIALNSLGISIPLSAIYKQVEFS